MTEKKCPVCSSTHLSTERCIDGNTKCLVCGYKAKHKDFYNFHNPQTPLKPVTETVIDYGLENILYTDAYDAEKNITETSEIIIAKGGDGTLLKAINLFAYKKKAFFGVAKGTENFLMNPEDTVSDNPKYKKFNRIKIKVNYIENIQGYVTELNETFMAFNDVMIGGDMNAWITFNVHDADKIIGKFKGGGIIISTAQGSTGINRNNGGSIMPLNSNQWFITGDKTDRKISVPIEPKRTSISVESRTPVTVWIDGQNHIIQNVKSIEISKGDQVQVVFNDYDEFKKKRRV